MSYRRVQRAFPSWDFQYDDKILVGRRGRYQIMVCFLGSGYYGDLIRVTPWRYPMPRPAEREVLQQHTSEDPVELVAELVAWCYREGDLW